MAIIQMKRPRPSLGAEMAEKVAADGVSYYRGPPGQEIELGRLQVGRSGDTSSLHTQGPWRRLKVGDRTSVRCHHLSNTSLTKTNAVTIGRTFQRPRARAAVQSLSSAPPSQEKSKFQAQKGLTSGTREGRVAKAQRNGKKWSGITVMLYDSENRSHNHVFWYFLVF